MPRKYQFYPAWNGKKASPVTEWFVKAMRNRWKFTNLGIYANRTMRGSENLSVHATGWACDIGYTDRKVAVEAWDWLIAHTKELRIAEIHDYRFGEFGRGYRCSRGEGQKGVVEYRNAKESAGKGGSWLHVEIEDTWESAKDFEAAWRALPKP